MEFLSVGLTTKINLLVWDLSPVAHHHQLCAAHWLIYLTLQMTWTPLDVSFYIIKKLGSFVLILLCAIPKLQQAAVDIHSTTFSKLSAGNSVGQTIIAWNIYPEQKSSWSYKRSWAGFQEGLRAWSSMKSLDDPHDSREESDQTPLQESLWPCSGSQWSS